MAKGTKSKSPSAAGGKPKHSNDANRPNKSVGGKRDAATVSLRPAMHVDAGLRGESGLIWS
jgi:hypothetical protein